MIKVIEIKFKTSGRVYYFDPLDLPIKAGDGVIVETARGMEFGEAANEPKERRGLRHRFRNMSRCWKSVLRFGTHLSGKAQKST